MKYVPKVAKGDSILVTEIYNSYSQEDNPFGFLSSGASIPKMGHPMQVMETHGRFILCLPFSPVGLPSNPQVLDRNVVGVEHVNPRYLEEYLKCLTSSQTLLTHPQKGLRPLND